MAYLRVLNRNKTVLWIQVIGFMIYHVTEWGTTWYIVRSPQVAVLSNTERHAAELWRMLPARVRPPRPENISGWRGKVGISSIVPCDGLELGPKPWL